MTPYQITAIVISAVCIVMLLWSEIEHRKMKAESKQFAYDLSAASTTSIQYDANGGIIWPRPDGGFVCSDMQAEHNFNDNLAKYKTMHTTPPAFKVNAPSYAQATGLVASTDYTYIGKKVTTCVLTLKNGAVVTGEAFCADVDKYSRERGEDAAYQKALGKVFEFAAFLNHEDAYRVHLAGADYPRYQD
jgi:hypothetical protein